MPALTKLAKSRFGETGPTNRIVPGLPDLTHDLPTGEALVLIFDQTVR